MIRADIDSAGCTNHAGASTSLIVLSCELSSEPRWFQLSSSTSILRLVGQASNLPGARKGINIVCRDTKKAFEEDRPKHYTGFPETG